jgi:hypothetical protein
MRIDLPPAALAASRTMMLDELETLLDGCARNAPYDDYAAAILSDNILHKATYSTRQKSLRHLRELYALRADVPTFGGLRAIWWEDPESRPQLAVMCAAARDPLVRCSIEAIENATPGAPVTPKALADAVQAAFPGRFSPDVSGRIGRNIASTWTQSGHLASKGRTTPKLRVRIKARPTAGLFALYLGHLAGLSGPALLATPWTTMLDADAATMTGIAQEAGRLGWLDFAASGGMIQIGFDHLDSIALAGETNGQG